METQKLVKVKGAEFLLTEFHDLVHNTTSIEIKQEGFILGEIKDLSIPYVDEEDETIVFNELIIDWLDDNYFKN